MKIQWIGASVFMIGILWILGFARSSNGEPPPAKPTESPDRVLKEIYPFLRKYCNVCHNNVDPHASRSLTDYQDEKSILKDREAWVEVVRSVENKLMPPANHSKQPSATEIGKFVKISNQILEKETPAKK